MEKNNNRAGIYAIVNIANGHKYVGQASNLSKRHTKHFDDLKSGKHFNAYLQNAYKKYGKANFSFTILEYVDDPHETDLSEREQYWIDKLNPEYNLMRFASNIIDYKGFRAKYVVGADDVLVLKTWQKYKAPAWNSWVYGGARNPQLDNPRPPKKGAQNG